MCVFCRIRSRQTEMIRLQCNFQKELVLFTGSGRSFYLCHNCINEKNIVKKVERYCKSKENIKEMIYQIKERLVNED